MLVVQQVVRQFSLTRTADTWYRSAAAELLTEHVVKADCWIVLENTRDVWIDQVSLAQLS